MKLSARFALTASLILASGAAWGHPGHEAIGDVLHIEYLLAAGAAAGMAVFGLIRRKHRRED